MSTEITLEDFLGQSPAALPENDLDLGPLLLALMPVEMLLVSVLGEPRPSFIEARWGLDFPAFPAHVEQQLVATAWRLPAGEHTLEIGLLDYTETPLAVSAESVTLSEPTFYTSLHRLTDVDLPQPGLYLLAARLNGQRIGANPLFVNYKKASSESEGR